jgi:FkbM family methyltransferase
MNKFGSAWRTLREKGFAATAAKTAAYLRSHERKVRQQIRVDARGLVRKVRASDRDKGLFIDCGSNVGQGFEEFERWFPLKYYDFVIIEPNPRCWEALRSLVASRTGNIELVTAAASTVEGEAAFFGSADDYLGRASVGGSLSKHHNNVFHQPDPGHPITVRTFSLADLVRRKAQHYSSVVMKLDIEGAECDVLEDMLAKDAVSVLDAIYIEFHSGFLVEPQRSQCRQRELQIQAELDRRGILHRLWW